MDWTIKPIIWWWWEDFCVSVSWVSWLYCGSWKITKSSRLGPSHSLCLLVIVLFAIPFSRYASQKMVKYWDQLNNKGELLESRTFGPEIDSFPLPKWTDLVYYNVACLERICYHSPSRTPRNQVKMNNKYNACNECSSILFHNFIIIQHAQLKMWSYHDILFDSLAYILHSPS